MEITSKTCTKCGTEKDLSKFHKQKLGLLGVRSTCKDCRSTRVNFYPVSEKEGYKYCKKCEKELPLSEFSSDKTRSDGLYTYCRDCTSTYRIPIKDKMSKYNKEYAAVNKQRILARRKELRQTEVGKLKHLNYQHKRNTKEKKGDVTVHQLQWLKEHAKTCYWCGCSLDRLKINFDHYYPLARGGEHTISNIVVSCLTCNQSKNAKDPIEFANSIGKLL